MNYNIHKLIWTRLLGCALICTASVTSLKGADGMNSQTDQTVSKSGNKEVITVGGGCFWCIEAIFEQLKGVESVMSGYSGGSIPNPSYEDVCSGRTGHAEVVQITFDPKVILLKDLLQVFFTLHDPTTPNQQGADVGTQYRSVVFYRNEDQKAVTEQVITEIGAAKVWNGRIVTEIVPFKEFYKAESYHQNYYAQNSSQGYCRIVITPKIAKLRKQFLSKLKKQ